jgi:cell division septation protein DedD
MRKKQAKAKKAKKKDKALLRLSGRQVAGWFGIFCFIYICIFLLGIIVGRGMAPGGMDTNELQTELAELRARVIEKKKGSIEKNTETLVNNAEFLFPAEAKSEGVIRQEKRRGSTSAIPHKTRSAGLRKKSGRPPQGGQVSPSRSGDVHVIQVASLSNKETADLFVKRLRQKGYRAYHVKVRISENRVRYRVRVGSFRDRSESYRVMAELKKEYRGAIFVSQ